MNKANNIISKNNKDNNTKAKGVREGEQFNK